MALTVTVRLQYTSQAQNSTMLTSKQYFRWLLRCELYIASYRLVTLGGAKTVFKFVREPTYVKISY